MPKDLLAPQVKDQQLALRLPFLICTHQIRMAGVMSKGHTQPNATPYMCWEIGVVCILEV